MVRHEPAGEGAVPEPRLDDRIVDLLQREPGALAFNGLRRALGAHPESLTRALRRLERLGLVTRAEHGYALLADSEGPRTGPEPGPLRGLAAVDLAPGVTRGDLLGALAGRWFGPLRWVGVYERPGDPLLVWSVEGVDGHVLLGVRRGALRVYVDRPRTPPATDPLDRAARDLLVHGLSRLDAGPRRAAPAFVGFAARGSAPRGLAS